MQFDKNYFSQFKDEIEEEHKSFETHVEMTELPNFHCNHKGKVKAVPGGLRCQCGTGWQGTNVAMLLKHFNEGV